MNTVYIKLTGIALLVAASAPAHSIAWPSLNEDFHAQSIIVPSPHAQNEQDILWESEGFSEQAPEPKPFIGNELDDASQRTVLIVRGA